MNAANKYLDNTIHILKKISEEQMSTIEQAAQLCYNAIKNKRMIYTFGTGHSHMLAEEIFYRAGGLVRVYPILDTALMLHEGAAKSTAIERLEGYAAILAEHYAISEGSVMFIFSNSGRNSVTVDMALEAKKRGLSVVAVTNKKHSDSVTSRHSSGKKLADVADVVLDNGGCIGDASVAIGTNVVGPTSTAVGAAIMQSIVCRTVELCVENQVDVEVFSSSNVDRGDFINNQFIAEYRDQIRPLW